MKLSRRLIVSLAPIWLRAENCPAWHATVWLGSRLLWCSDPFTVRHEAHIFGKRWALKWYREQTQQLFQE